jgi:hypothetical protein
MNTSGSANHTLTPAGSNGTISIAASASPALPVNTFKITGLTGIYAERFSWWSMYYIHNSNAGSGSPPGNPPTFGISPIDTYIVPVNNQVGVGYRSNAGTGEIYVGAVSNTAIPIRQADVTAAGGALSPVVFITFYYLV